MKSERPPLSGIVDFAAIVTLIASVIYTAGWSYIFHWYGHFSLGVIGLGIPLEYHFQFGFVTLRDHWWFIIASIFMIITSPFWRRYVGWWLWVSSPAWLLIVFILVHTLGQLSAYSDFEQHRAEEFGTFPLVRVWLNDSDMLENPKTNTPKPKGLTDAKYRLLLQSADKLYLIRNDSGVSIPVTVLPLSSVYLMRVIPRNPGYQ